MPFDKCHMNCSSQYAYLRDNEQSIHVDDYIKRKRNLTCQNIFCLKGHELVCANGKKNKPHFRHKNLGDMYNNPMTEWHAEWQGNFPKTEIEFKKTCEQQIKTRIADVLLSETHVIEFQHSEMTKDEVNNRTSDYNIHNKTIIWVIDGNKNILVNELPKSGRVYLEFVTNLWKFQSFINCEFIYIDIDCEIYKICPKLIKSNMIDVQKPVQKHHFIECLLNNTELFADADPPQCKLFIKQQGAGNGKTYGIIQMLESDEFAHYKYFIYVSKQHSAVHVIYREFQQQIKNGNLSCIKLEGEPKLVNKKYIIQYYNLKTSEVCQIIIGTVDSFMYAIGNKNNTEIDKFEGIVNSIIDDHIETTTQCGSINYGGIKPKLFKKTILIGDEEQDLKPSYAKAIIQIMRNRYIDVYIVGDKLQSISNEVNAFTYLLENEFPFIETITYEFTNVCRRFNRPELINFVNAMIPFKKYNLPEIALAHQTLDMSKNPLTIFAGKTIYGTNANEDLINTEVETIMKYYEREVTEFSRLPKDFLIVTLFTQLNPLVDALQLAINIYWKRMDACDEFKRYAIFHKSEDGSSINLNESEDATRIVSIHSSKGDGRKVVFVIGLNESGLRSFSSGSDSLIYDSLFHVAITRMKEKLYIRCEGNDDISIKIQNYLQNTEFECSDIKPDMQIYNAIKLRTIKDCCKTEDNYRLFKDSVFDLINLQNLPTSDCADDKKIIDTSHHNVRFAAISIQLHLQIIKKEEEKKKEWNGNSDATIKKQIKAVFCRIIKTGITEVSSWKHYNMFLNKNNAYKKTTKTTETTETTEKYIPILKMVEKGRDYVKYFNIIVAFAKDILIKIKLVVDGKNVHDFCPLECMILYYMLEVVVCGRYTKCHISELYNIVDIYSKSFVQKSSRDAHNHCMCNKLFDTDNNASLNTCKINNGLESYLCVHYEKMNIISRNYMQFCSLYPNINWLMNYRVFFSGNTQDFEISNYYNLIGYDSESVIIAYIKPQFNSLNYNQILMDAVFDTYLVKNAVDHKFFSGKKISCVVFTTDLDVPYYINISNDILEQNETNIRRIVKDSVLSKYLIDGKIIYNFYKYWRKKCSNEIVRPLEIIDYIIQQFNVIKKEVETYAKCLPNYVTDFFNNIKFKLENCDKQQQKMILKEYDNKTRFIECLDKRLTDSVNRYFGLNLRDDDNDISDDDTGFHSD